MKRAALVAFYVLWAAVFAGWLCHSSPPDERFLLRWSRSYLPVLLVTALPFFLPPFLLVAEKRMGRRRLGFTIATLAVGGAVLYSFLAFLYYQRTTHPFDPYLQFPPARFVKSAKRAGSVRVLVLGGSTSRCENLPKEQSWPSVMERRLRAERPGLDLEVLNGAMGWYTTKHSLTTYVTYYRDFQPDIVVSMEAVNDMFRSLVPADFALGEYDELWSHYYGPAIEGARPPSFERRTLGKLGDTWYSDFRLVPVDWPLDRWRSLGPFERHLRELARRVKQDGAKPVLVTQPFLLKEKLSPDEDARLLMARGHYERASFFRHEYAAPASLARALAAFADRTRVVAREEGSSLADAEAGVEKDLTNFTDEVHTREPGARKTGEAVAAAILRDGLIR